MGDKNQIVKPGKKVLNTGEEHLYNNRLSINILLTICP